MSFKDKHKLIKHKNTEIEINNSTKKIIKISYTPNNSMFDLSEVNEIFKSINSIEDMYMLSCQKEISIVTKYDQTKINKIIEEIKKSKAPIRSFLLKQEFITETKELLNVFDKTNSLLGTEMNINIANVNKETMEPIITNIIITFINSVCLFDDKILSLLPKGVK